MRPRIRQAQPTDREALFNIESESFASPHWTGEDLLRYDCSVAEIDGIIAGFLVSRLVFAGDAANPAQREILNVAVDPAFRRCGIATALIAQVLSKSGEVFLEVRESNLAARQLYTKLGFVECGRREDYYQAPTETAIVMNMK